MSLLQKIKENKLLTTALAIGAIWLGMDVIDKGGCYCAENSLPSSCANYNETNGLEVIASVGDEVIDKQRDLYYPKKLKVNQA